MNTERSNEVLLRLATAVGDEEAVDWDRVGSIDDDARRKVNNIRLIQSIGEAHRQVREELLETTSSLTLVDERSWGKLQLRKRIASGGAGVVYRAWDPDLEREVALKLPSATVLDRADRGRRFLREARQLAKVNNDHVLRVLGADTVEGEVGLWTELVEGRTLEDLLRQTGRRSADEATSIGIELCRALAAVHGAGLIHRDVKTSNVVREEGGRIVLLDFSTAESSLVLREAGSTLISGTPRFMAPELFRGEPATVESDLYSLGVVLYRLVTVAYPVEAGTMDELMAWHERGEFRPLRDRRPDLPPTFVHVVEKALSPEPARRFASAGEMEHALEATRRGPERVLTEALQPPARGLGRKSTAWMAAVASVLVVALGVWWWIAHHQPPFDVATTFYRQTTEGAMAEALDEGDRIGGRIFLEVRANRDAYVYVIGEDLEGNTWRLFPAPAFEATNPLKGERLHVVPEEGGGWEMSSPSEREFFLVVVADRSLREIESVLPNLRPVQPTASDASAPEGATRGYGREAPSGFKGPGRRILPDLAEDIEALEAHDDGVWHVLYEFEGSSAD